MKGGAILVGSHEIPKHPEQNPDIRLEWAGGRDREGQGGWAVLGFASNTSASLPKIQIYGSNRRAVGRVRGFGLSQRYVSNPRAVRAGRVKGDWAVIGLA